MRINLSIEGSIIEFLVGVVIFYFAFKSRIDNVDFLDEDSDNIV